MNRQQIRKIKEYAEKLLQLCDGEPIPSHKTSGNGHWKSCDWDAYQAALIRDKPTRDYHKRVLDVLGPDAPDWLYITRTFEDRKREWFRRLDEMRREILLHTDVPEKGGSWLEAQGGNFGPNEHLRSEIERLADELIQVVKTEGKKKRRNARSGKAGAAEPQRKAGHGKPASSGDRAAATQRENAPTGEALALAMLVEHPKWSDTKIAKAVGVNRTTLYDWPNFKKAKEALKQGKKELPRGSKNGETGEVEAWGADTSADT